MKKIKVYNNTGLPISIKKEYKGNHYAVTLSIEDNKMVDHWPVSYSLSEEERKLVDDFRREKTLINAENEKSSNQRAIEILHELRQFMPDSALDDLVRDIKRLVLLPSLPEYNALNVYQNNAAETAIYPGKGTPLGLIYCALKLSGEAGEVAENVGKAIRDDGLVNPKYGIDNELDSGYILAERKSKIKLELGDVLWYVSQAAKELGFTLEEIAQDNLEKLGNRAKNGTLKGSGDDR